MSLTLPTGSSPRRVLARVTRITLAVVLLSGTPAAAQDVTEPALKAAFIYNFAKFTEWPFDALPAASPLVMCVVGDPAVGEALERSVAGRVLSSHVMNVSSGPIGGSQRGCHVLYVSGMTPTQAALLVAGVRDAPVLTISDIDGFTAMGGMVRFFFEQGRLRFGIHLESAKRARLQVSSRLLALARPQ